MHVEYTAVVPRGRPHCAWDGRCAVRALTWDHVDLEGARLLGHTGGSEVTETVYRKLIRPVLLDGAEAMDRLFPGRSGLA